MDSEERSKKRGQLWSRAAVHYSLCFAVGVFAALAPLATTGAPSTDSIRNSLRPSSSAAGMPAPAPAPAAPELDLLLIVTVTRPDDDMSQEASLTRLAHTLHLVAPPLLWIVVGAGNTTATRRTVHALRGSGVMFRHLAYAAENFTDPGDESDHQRNVALSHIKRHRLAGVVHFAGASGVYDLRFFQQLRRTRGIAAWPVATVSSTDQGVTVEGPTCNSSQITGWYSEDSGTNTTQITHVAAFGTSASNKNSSSSRPPEINISAVGFKSSILWDSEEFIDSHWSNSSSTGETQELIQFVRQMAISDEDKRRGIPSDCSESQVRLWNFDMPRSTQIIEELDNPQNQTLLEGDEKRTS